MQDDSVLGNRDSAKTLLLRRFELLHHLHERMLEFAELFVELHIILSVFLLR